MFHSQLVRVNADTRHLTLYTDDRGAHWPVIMNGNFLGTAEKVRWEDRCLIKNIILYAATKRAKFILLCADFFPGGFGGCGHRRATFARC